MGVGRRLPLLLTASTLLTFLVTVLDATVLSSSLADKTAAIATGAITVALSMLSGGCLALSTKCRTVRSTTSPAGLASNPRGRKYIEELPGLILPAILCLTAIAYVASAAALGSPTKMWVILLCVVATLCLPLLAPLSPRVYTVSALVMAVVLAAGVLVLSGRRELGDVVAALVLVVLLLAAPAPLALLHSLRLQHDSALASIEQEMRAQQVLLHRVIPSVFVDALVHDRKTTSPPMPDISVMFVEVMVLAADGSSPPRKLGSNMQGDTLDILSHVFKILDRVVSQNGVFKVETVGSEFMAVSGLPSQLKHHVNTAYAAVVTAIDMQRAVLKDLGSGGLRQLTRGRFSVSLQIGINSGWVVEAILGKRLLPRYKLFGDAVNTASRMKSTGLFGRINVSRATRDLLMRDAVQILRVAQARPASVVEARPPTSSMPLTEHSNHGAADTLSIPSPVEINDLPTAAPGVLDGVPVSVSELDVTFARATGFFLRPRPARVVKGKGTMCMYLVELCRIGINDTMPPLRRVGSSAPLASCTLSLEPPLPLDCAPTDLSQSSLEWLAAHEQNDLSSTCQETLLLHFARRFPARWTGQTFPRDSGMTLPILDDAASGRPPDLHVWAMSTLQHHPDTSTDTSSFRVAPLASPTRVADVSNPPRSTESGAMQRVELGSEPRTPFVADGLTPPFSIQPLAEPRDQSSSVGVGDVRCRGTLNHGEPSSSPGTAEDDATGFASLRERAGVGANDAHKDQQRALSWRALMRKRGVALSRPSSGYFSAAGSMMFHGALDLVQDLAGGGASLADAASMTDEGLPSLPGTSDAAFTASFVRRPLDVERVYSAAMPAAVSLRRGIPPADIKQPNRSVRHSAPVTSPSQQPLKRRSLHAPTERAILDAVGLAAVPPTETLPSITRGSSAVSDFAGEEQAAAHEPGLVVEAASGGGNRDNRRSTAPAQASDDFCLDLDPWSLSFLAGQKPLNDAFAACRTMKMTFGSLATVAWEAVVVSFLAASAQQSDIFGATWVSSVFAVLLVLYGVSTLLLITLSACPCVSGAAQPQRLPWQCRTYCTSLCVKLSCGIALIGAYSMPVVSHAVSINGASTFGQWTSVITCCTAFSLLASGPLCYGLLLQHYYVFAALGFSGIVAALAVSQPPSWGLGIPWLAAALVADAILVHRWERQQREAFFILHVMRAHQGKTQEMLYAMLPPEIADQMATREQLRALVEHAHDMPPSETSPRLSVQDARAPDDLLDAEASDEGDDESESPRRVVRGDPLLLGQRPGRELPNATTDRVAIAASPVSPTPEAGEGTAHRPLGYAKLGGTRRSFTEVTTAISDRVLRPFGAPPAAPNLSRRIARALNPGGGDAGAATILNLGAQLSHEYRKARTHMAALLMFDLVSFTAMSKDLGPQSVLELLDSMYTSFDRILRRRGALKIETIGDAIFVACGVPQALPLHKSARIIAKVALDMVASVKTFDHAWRAKLKSHRLAARIGIHCGEVLAGVIGEDMPRYQLFGPAVDEVQALESGGEAGGVHASAAIARYLKGSPSGSAEGDGEGRVASDIKIVNRQEDGSVFIQRDRAGGARGGLAW